MAILRKPKTKRGCGYVQVGATYLVCDALQTICDRMPFELPTCPVCGEHIRFSRSIQKLNPLKLFDKHGKGCKCPKRCPACYPKDEVAALMWVGDKFYTPEEFVEEARKIGVSKRIANAPSFVELGKTWIFLAHKKAIKAVDAEAGNSGLFAGDGELIDKPGIIMAFQPQRIEKVVKESDLESDPEMVKRYEEKEIDLLAVPDDDSDYTTPSKGKSKKDGSLLNFMED